MPETKNENLVMYKENVQLQRENLNFYKENKFTPLLDIADQIGDQIDLIHNSVDGLITKQVEKNPKRMSEEDKKQWYQETLSSLVMVNQMLQSVSVDVKKVRHFK
ncbi:hypothetical protein [Paraliobacillus zengyii]|uniref:hypothetical protein n=1 Tax=Paraliobacillus zengyii TaxID=2213194 RepID=UPI000DD449EB|nr:hypothetical protein [Paraliobacillus zengyii]